MEKLFKVAGVSTDKGVIKPRFANDMNRIAMLERAGHSNINLIELPNSMNKIQAISFLLDDKGFQESDVHSALLSSLGTRQKKAELLDNRNHTGEVNGKPSRGRPRGSKNAQKSEDTISAETKRPRGRPRKNQDSTVTLEMTPEKTATPNTTHKVAKKKEQTSTDFIEKTVEAHTPIDIGGRNSKPAATVTKERTVTEHTVHTAEIMDTIDINYTERSSGIILENQQNVGRLQHHAAH